MLAAQPAPTSAPIPVKVVVVTMFEIGADTGDAPGEFQRWAEGEHLTKRFPLPNAYHDALMNDDGVLGIVTGMGTIRAAATVMALGSDPRFDFSHATGSLQASPAAIRIKPRWAPPSGPTGSSMATSRTRSTRAKSPRPGPLDTFLCASPRPTSSPAPTRTAWPFIWKSRSSPGPTSSPSQSRCPTPRPSARAACATPATLPTSRRTSSGATLSAAAPSSTASS